MSEVNPNIQAISQELTTSTTAPPSDDGRVAEITTEILQHKKQVACSFIQIGKLLDEAKGRLKKKGQWLKWLESSVDISVRMAQRYIQLAQAFPDATSISHLGVTKALALLALPEAQRETFLNEPHEINGEKKQIGDMSVREIQTAIREQTRPIEQPAEDTTESVSSVGKGDTASDESVKGSEKAKRSMMFKPVLSNTDDPETSNTKLEPNEQSGSAGSELLASDIESANNQVDNILKILESQVAGIVQDSIVRNLRSLHEKVQQCLNLAAIEVPTS